MTKRDYSLLDKFLDERILDAHPNYVYEDPANTHIARTSIDILMKKYLQVNNLVLDVGCGTGRDMKYMDGYGLEVIGLNFLESEINDIRGNDGRKLKVYCADQSFTPFCNGTFDCVWSRHCLEHSIMPYFTLVEYNRILKDNGICYIELPAPGTNGQHETNPNHYSVMGKIMWENLFKRSGFEIMEQKEAEFEHEGKIIDVFYCYFLRKIGLPFAGYFRNLETRGVTMEKFQK